MTSTIATRESNTTRERVAAHSPVLVSYHSHAELVSYHSHAELADPPARRHRSGLRRSSRSLGDNSFPNIFDLSVPPCPNPKGRWNVDVDTGEATFEPFIRWLRDSGEILTWRCSRNSCPSCVITNARRIAGAIRLSEPTHAVALTQVGNDRDTIRERVARFSASMRRTLPEFRWVWAAEPNPRGTGTHIHGFAHTGTSGSEIEDLSVAKAARSSCVGSVLHVRDIKPNSNAQYFAYPMKSLADPKLQGAFLGLNGTPERIYLIRASKTGFWRIGEDGPSVTRTKAQVEAYRQAVERNVSRPVGSQA